jgi:uncharacterized membrane protein YphA (DoxX/SURF4 family)
MGARLLILAARIAAGVIMLRAGLEKLRSGWIANQGLERTVAYADHAFGFFRGFLTHTVANHIKLFSYLVVAGELGVGVCLILGFLTRWASFTGLLMMIFFAMASGVALSPSPPVLMGLTFLLLSAINAGMIAGVDRWLRGRAPDWVV